MKAPSSLPDMEFENCHYAQGCRIVAGIDEAGRGPLAGPVVVAAVILPRMDLFPLLDGLNDSKKLTHKKRELLYERIVNDERIDYAVVEINAPEIDKLNILGATHEGMRRAASQLKSTPDMCLIDGLPVRIFPYPQEAIVKGDARSLSIAAASILAKVTRDRLMESYAEIYPEYGFEKHKGYGTKEHLIALERYGPTPIHRRSFAPVAQTTLPLF